MFALCNNTIATAVREPNVITGQSPPSTQM